MRNLEIKVRDYINRYRMIENGDRVIVGVSGGADSVCLFFVLLELQREMGFSFVAVHVNHGLRGADADADEQFVRGLCEKYGVPLEISRVDLELIAKKRKQSLEEAGRDVRREMFARVMAQYGGSRIALAHHQNDNAETMLWNLARGTGLHGLSGIRPVNGVWIRPLLCLSRQEIEAYLQEREQGYCTDFTNLETIYTRNKLRHQVIPILETEVNSAAVRHMNETMEQMCELREFVEQETEKAFERCVAVTKKDGKDDGAVRRNNSGEEDNVVRKNTGGEEGSVVRKNTGGEEGNVVRKSNGGGEGSVVRKNNSGEEDNVMMKEEGSEREGFGDCYRISVEEWKKLPGLLQKEIIYSCLERLCGSRKDLGRIHIEAVAELFDKQTGKERNLPEKIRAVRGYNEVVLEKVGYAAEWDGNTGGIDPFPEVKIQIPGVTAVSEMNLEIITQVLEKGDDFKVSEIPQKRYTKWFDYDIMKCLYFRTRKGGDSIVIDSAGHSQKLKSWFVNEKIPAKERPKIPMLVDGQQIVWIIGHRMSSAYQVSEQTKRILQIEVKRLPERSEQ